MHAADGTGQAGHTVPQHVWVDLSSGRYPGLLVEWRPLGRGWQGWCLWAAGGPIVQQAWLDARQLSPYDAPTGVPL